MDSRVYFLPKETINSLMSPLHVDPVKAQILQEGYPFVLCVMVGMEPRTSHNRGKHSSTEYVDKPFKSSVLLNHFRERGPRHSTENS